MAILESRDCLSVFPLCKGQSNPRSDDNFSGTERLPPVALEVLTGCGADHAPFQPLVFRVTPDSAGSRYLVYTNHCDNAVG